MMMLPPSDFIMMFCTIIGDELNNNRHTSKLCHASYYRNQKCKQLNDETTNSSNLDLAISDLPWLYYLNPY